MYIYIHTYTHTYMATIIDKLNISLCQSPSIQCLQFSHQRFTHLAPQKLQKNSRFQSPKVHLKLWPRMWGCSLSQKSGHTKTHTPVYRTRPPKLIRKSTYLRKAKMEFLFNLFSWAWNKIIDVKCFLSYKNLHTQVIVIIKIFYWV